LIENEYFGVDYKMRFICSCGEVGNTTFYNFRKGSRCKKCNGIKSGKARLLSTKETNIRKIEKSGCKVVGEYEGRHSFIDILCACGSKASVNVHNACRNGGRCEKCSMSLRMKKKGMKHWTYAKAVRTIESYGGELMSSMENYSPSEVYYRCSECKTISKSYMQSIVRSKCVCSSCAVSGERSGAWKGGVYVTNPKEYKIRWNQNFVWREDIKKLKEESLNHSAIEEIAKCFGVGNNREEVIGRVVKQIEDRTKFLILRSRLNNLRRLL
jgi:hypothetical protein